MNRQVRCAAGVDGTVVILSAWCQKCRQESMPDRNGACMFCATRIVNEDTLSSSAMLDQISGPGTIGHSRAVAESGASRRAETPSRSGARTQWTRKMIVEAIQEWAFVHGAPPSSTEWVKKLPGYPTYQTVWERFGSWRLAVEAAGFRPQRLRAGATCTSLPVTPPEELIDALKVA